MTKDSATGHSAKDDVRQIVRAARLAMTEADQAEHDAARTARLLGRVAGHATLACYVSRGTEPDTSQVLEELAEGGVRVLLPVVSAPLDVPRWAWWCGEPMEQGRFGIAQPQSEPQPIDVLAQADIIILPGLAATTAGHRLGRGGGWYDRALLQARVTAPRWLLLNDAEVRREVPTDPWDQPVDAIVTEHRWITCARTTDLS